MWIFWLFALGFIIVFILGNALLDYNASHALSGWLVRLLRMDFRAGAENTDFFLRKIAHITEYTLLGLLIQMARILLKKQNKNISIWLPLFCILSIGVLDEFFQSFSGRTSVVSDVILDFMGGLLGMIITALLHITITRKKQKNHIGGKCNE